MADCSELRDKLLKYIKKLAESKNESDFAPQNIFQMFMDHAACISNGTEITTNYSPWQNNRGVVILSLKINESTCQYLIFHLSFKLDKMEIKSRNEFKNKDELQTYNISDIDKNLVEKIYRNIMIDLD